MSTTVVAPKTRKIGVSQVRAVLEDIAIEHPDRVDRRATDGLPARYAARGGPNCLVAMVLDRLGFSVGILKALDAEHPTGELFRAGGVQVAESRHPALKRIDPTARALLQYVQNQQDRGQRWGRIVRDAFSSNRFFERWERERKPWLSV